MLSEKIMCYWRESGYGRFSSSKTALCYGCALDAGVCACRRHGPFPVIVFLPSVLGRKKSQMPIFLFKAYN